VLQAKAQRLLNYAGEVHAAMESFKGVKLAHLRIAGSSIPGEYLIPAVLPRLIQKYPGLNITLAQGDSRQVHEWLVAEQVELGVVGGHFPGEKLEFRPLCNDEIVLIAPKDHRWARGRTIRIEELTTEQFVLRKEGSGTGQNSLMALREAGINVDALHKTATLGSSQAVIQAVIAGAGVSFVSAISVKDELGQGLLVQVPIRDIVITRKFFLVGRKGRELSPAARAFAEVMTEFYGSRAAEQS
jgi:DNA-binding transcriptional LysR family regulator